MAFTTGAKYQAQAAPPGAWSIDGVEFDAWLQLSHSASSTITSHPVETGANISDHVFINPRRFTFTLGVTNSPVATTPPSFSGVNTRSINARTALEGMMRDRRLLKLVSKYGVYTNVLIESIDTPDDVRTVNALITTVTLVEIILASSQTVKVSLNPQATNYTNKGQVTTQPPRQNFVDAAKNWLGGLFR